MNRLVLLGIALSFSVNAFSSAEVVCAIYSDYRKGVVGDDKINRRIKELEALGKTVEVTHLATSTGAGGNPGGVVVVDKTCAALKY